MSIPPMDKKAVHCNGTLPRFAQLLLVVIAAVAWVVAFIPTNDAFTRLLGAAVFMAVILVSLVVGKRRKGRRVRADTSSVSQRIRGPRPQKSSEPEKSAAKKHAGSISHDWLGPFNPDDGLPLDESPDFARYDDIPIPTTYSDHELLD